MKSRFSNQRAACYQAALDAIDSLECGADLADAALESLAFGPGLLQTSHEIRKVQEKSKNRWTIR